MFLCIWMFWSMINGKVLLQNFSIEATLPLRGILALGIIIHHIALWVELTLDEDSIIAQFCSLGAPIVAIFFFLFGYGLMKNLMIKGSVYLQGFLRRRLLKIVFPWLLCSFIYVLAAILFLGGHFCSIKNDWPFLPNAWFCVTITIYYIAFYLAARCGKENYKKVLFVLWLFSVLYISCLTLLCFESWWWQTVSAFNVGMTVCVFEPNIRKILTKNYALMTCSLFIIALILSVVFSNIEKTKRPYSIILLGSLLTLLVYCLICGCKLYSNRIAQLLGSLSYEIYLVQGAVITLVYGKAYTYISNWWIFMALLVLLFIFIFAIVLKKVDRIVTEKLVPKVISGIRGIVYK